MDSQTELLAEYIAQAKFEDIPEYIVEYAKNLILDSIGCVIGGFTLQPGKIIIDFFTELGGYPEASILATGGKLPCIHAAYINSYLANLLDFDDDISGIADGHPGATIIPPGLALAEKIRASGKDFITAVVVAYEAWMRISQAIRSSPERCAKVYGLSTHQIFSAAIASSKLLKFNTEQTANALGLAGATAPVPNAGAMGLDDRPISWLKNNFGWASMGGVLSALLTERGFSGNKHILDEDRGFWLMAGSDQCDFEKLTLNLGKDYLISEIGFKPYAACRYTHSSLEATAKIMAKHSIDVDKIKRVEVNTSSQPVEDFAANKPTNILDAQFSLPHLIALELLGKSPSKGLSGDNLNDPKVQSLAEKVSLHLSPEIDERFQQNKKLSSSVVSIEQVDGSLFSERVDIPKWDPETRPTKEELQAKFVYLSIPIIGIDASQALIRDVEQLENLKDVSSMISRIFER